MKWTLGIALTLLLSPICTTTMAAEASGEWWEVSNKMEMPGMPAGMAGMGGQAQKICIPKGQEGKPVKSRGDDDCEMTDLKQSGNTMTFKMTCKGKDAMTGSGEFTHTPNGFSQKVKMRSDGQDMSIVSTGKRVGGACKGDEQMNQALGGAAASMARTCQTALEENQYGQFLKSTAQLAGDRKASCAAMPSAESRKNCEAAGDIGCTELRPQMCARLAADLKSFDKFDKFASKGLTLAAECGQGTEQIVQQHCSTGLDSKDWRFVNAHCQKDGRVAALRKQHCAGRDYTSVNANHRSMCAELGGFGRGSAGSGDADTADSSTRSVSQKDAAKPSAVDELKKEGANLLRNLFK
ncbi:MAG: DUF3617 family protein [Burkholderiaceae bacterium]